LKRAMALSLIALVLGIFAFRRLPAPRSRARVAELAVLAILFGGTWALGLALWI